MPTTPQQLEDGWVLLEDQFDPQQTIRHESRFSLGNGLLHQRGYFEESYSGASCRFNYMQGVYQAGEQKHKSAPHSSSLQLLPLPDWAAIDLIFDGVPLDLAHCQVIDFQRSLHLKEGYLKRSFQVRMSNKIDLKIETTRFCSLNQKEVGAIRYSITPLNLPVQLVAIPLIDAKEASLLWEEVDRDHSFHEAYLSLRSTDGQQKLCSGMRYAIFQDAYKLDCTAVPTGEEGWLGHQIGISLPRGSTTTIYKFTAQFSAQYYEASSLLENCQQSLRQAVSKGFTQMLTEHTSEWSNYWKSESLTVSAPAAVQQTFRLYQYHLQQTFSRVKNQLLTRYGHVGPREDALSWETELMFLPYFLWRGEYPQALRLLLHRYQGLPTAVQQAQKMGMENGAALYPDQALSGQEQTTEIDHALGGIYRNGIIAWAIHQYVTHTDDQAFMAAQGLEMLIALARFWAQRVSYSPRKQQYVLLGVNGPNRFESQVQNNWLTNRLAQWTLRYTAEVLETIKESHPVRFAGIIGKTDLDFSGEIRQWERVADNLYLPVYAELSLSLQQDGYLDKAQQMVSDLPTDALPLRQNWSWDRLMRSCFLEQADVLLYYFLFPEKTPSKSLKTDFEFYTHRTTHEGTTSPIIHGVLAASLQQYELTDQFFQQALKNETDTDGNMDFLALPGPYLMLILAYLGAKWRENQLQLQPRLPVGWTHFQMEIQVREHQLKLSLDAGELTVRLLSNSSLSISVLGEEYVLTQQAGQTRLSIALPE